MGKGDSPDDNPDFSVRRRFAKLYQVCGYVAVYMLCHLSTARSNQQDYKPEFHYWRLVLLSRKCCFVTITVLFKRNAMFQVRLAEGMCAATRAQF